MQVEQIFQDVESLNTIRAAMVGYLNKLRETKTIAHTMPEKFNPDVVDYWIGQLTRSEEIIKAVNEAIENHVKTSFYEIQSKLEPQIG